MLEAKGWHVEKLHGNQFQEGLPDLAISHMNYSLRFIETKVRRGNTLKFTDAQKRKFPILHATGWPIFVIAHEDLRGLKMQTERERMYAKLFREPNVMLALDKYTVQYVF